MQQAALIRLANEGPTTLKVRGGCMGLAVPDGSHIRIQPKRWYWPGEIVVCPRADGSLVSHRFLGYVRGRRHWLGLTQADRATEPDHTFKASSILGSLRAIDGRPVRCSARARLQALARYMPALHKALLQRLDSRRHGIGRRG